MVAHKSDSDRLVQHHILNLWVSNKKILKKKSIFFTMYLTSPFRVACQPTKIVLKIVIVPS